MEALRARKKQLEVGEMTKKMKKMVPKLIGHIEKVEEEEVEEDTEEANVVPTEDDGDECVAAKDTAATGKDAAEQIVGGDMDDRSKRLEKETGMKGGKKDELKKNPRSTPSAARLKEEKCQVRIKEQERRWKEATEKGLGEPAGDIDLKDAMMSPEEEEKQMEKGKNDTDEGGTYGKVYTKTHEKIAERSVS